MKGAMKRCTCGGRGDCEACKAKKVAETARGRARKMGKRDGEAREILANLKGRRRGIAARY